jgi:hypothetical protein
MTAEVAILNKSAVALAADSAVTISVGNDQQKTFDSEDKLFELTKGNSIGIMINNGMSFLETPLPVLIKEYRRTAPVFERVQDAADDFLKYLNDFATKSPLRVRQQSTDGDILPLFERIKSQALEKWKIEIFGEQGVSIKPEYAQNINDFSAILQTKIDEQIELCDDIVEQMQDASFVGEGNFILPPEEENQIRLAAEQKLAAATDAQRESAVQLALKFITKNAQALNSTGVVVAGFGTADLFPTLISIELFGVFGGRLKYFQHETIDIDRDGDRARVLPFAQRDMVERFLYGLDSTIKSEITKFCRESVSQISDEIIGQLKMSDADREDLFGQARAAEVAFISRLGDEGFKSVHVDSRSEIEEMVEFMPKPEMARMAEALVNLTSIKRRVTRGFETVGGPIDVAVISKADGFVWVKRKHYFTPELNSRYFDRIKGTQQ